MAVKEKIWNVVVDEVTYKVTLAGNKISVNNGEPVKFTKLEKAIGEGKGSNYIVPLGNEEAILRVSTYGGVALTMDGKDCLTGKEYEALKAPWWVWIHVVIHALGFIFLIGGAIGGAVQAGVDIMMLSVASDNSRNETMRIAICTGILVISLVLQFVLACLIVGALL